MNWIVRKWDMLVYRVTYRSLNRMLKNDPGKAYLMELHLRSWREDHPLPDRLKKATEIFFEAVCREQEIVDGPKITEPKGEN